MGAGGSLRLALGCQPGQLWGQRLIPSRNLPHPLLSILQFSSNTCEPKKNPILETGCWKKIYLKTENSK